ncbi:unnamed protein product, partial [Amoebophrya sp. A120]
FEPGSWLTAIQIRTGVQKGMLFLDTAIPDNDSAPSILFRSSMCKGSRDESRLEKSQLTLEVCPQGIVRTDRQSWDRTLNAQFLPLLEFLCAWEWRETLPKKDVDTGPRTQKDSKKAMWGKRRLSKKERKTRAKKQQKSAGPAKKKSGETPEP